MRKTKIQLFWDKGGNREIEIIEFPAEAGVHSITSTLDWWQPDARFYTYQVRGCARVDDRGGAYLELAWHEEDNLPEVEDSQWGELVLSIPGDMTEGQFTYHPSDGEASYQRYWRRVPEGSRDQLRQARTRETRTTMSRDDHFRVTVLAEDRCCVLTGEYTTAALEVAHIVPVADEGADVIQNAITLRADIHRLFDSDCFFIGTDGVVRFDENGGGGWVSSFYREMLEGKEIADSARDRVFPALEAAHERREAEVGP